ncbi:MAG: YeeE/YedE family protein [Methylococcales bacterium]
MKLLVALLCGILFGLGLAVSQMINPAKVIGFLNVIGNWDPSLAFVMGGALTVMTIARIYILRRPAPLLESQFYLPEKRTLDRRLIIGAILFGIGWGTAGFCPGPALASIGIGGEKVLIFVVSMLVGTLLFNHFFHPKKYCCDY